MRAGQRGAGPRSFVPQQGAALAYVLGILALFGLLTGLVIRYTRFNDALVARERWDAQARLLAHGGLDYALSRIDPPGPALDLAFTSEGVDYALENPNLSFRLEVAGRGLLGRAVSVGRTRLPGEGRRKVAHALVGQSLDFARLPAVGLLNREGNMVLAGNAQVTGAALLWRGGVRKATDYHVRFRGGPGHSGPLWDSTAPAWRRVEPDFRRAEAWARAQEALLAGGDPSRDPDYDSGQVTDLHLGDSATLADTALAGVRIRAGRKLSVGSGAVLVDCKLLAPEIEVSGNAVLENVVAFASRNLELTGGEVKGGQFAANDTLRLDLADPLEGWPVFFVRGRTVRAGRPDSAYLGCLRVTRASGGGFFLAAVDGRPAYDQEIRLELGKAASLTGLAYCGGFADVQGSLRGSLLCRNLRFEHMGTIWLGHLRDARIEGWSGTAPAPLVFPGFPLLAFGEGR